jgi:branched-chain amino acid transport system substrate-binding protein
MRFKLSVFVMIVVLLGLIFGCAAPQAPAGTQEPSASQQVVDKTPIKIGFISALATPYGKGGKAALEISIEEINKAGGIMGRPIELLVEDWKREVPLAVAAYKKLVMSDGCILVITEGTEGTIACREEAVKLFNDYPHLQFCTWTAGEAPMVVWKDPQKYKFLFRVYPRTGDSWDPKANSISLWKDIIGTKKLALVIEEIGWTEDYVKGVPDLGYPPIKEHFEKNGIQVVYFSMSSINEKMFLPFFEKIAASGADTIYWITGYTDTVTMVKQWADSAAKDIDLTTQSGAISYAAFWDMTGGAALGAVSTWPEAKIPFTPKSIPFLQALNAKGAGLTTETYGTCDGPYILKAAIEKAGGTKDINKLISALETVEVQNAFWIWKFDKNHEPYKGSPYLPTICGQFQGKDKYIAVFDEGVRKLANPNDKFIRVKELRAAAGK